LADEPTGQLDSKSGEEVMSITAFITCRAGTTLDQLSRMTPVLRTAASRIVHLKDGEIVAEENVMEKS